MKSSSAKNLMSFDDRKKILRERANALAKTATIEAPKMARLEFLEFSLGHENYAVEACRIREVCPLKPITPVPCVPGFVLGIMNLRGKIVSVIDLKKFLGLSETPVTDSTKVLIVFFGQLEVGILVDAILGVKRFGASEIEQDMSELLSMGTQFLSGVTVDSVGIINIPLLLGQDRIVVNEEVDV